MDLDVIRLDIVFSTEQTCSPCLAGEARSSNSIRVPLADAKVLLLELAPLNIQDNVWDG